MFLTSFFGALLAILATIAEAGYDTTSWGMPLAAIKAMYPGGVERPGKGGEIEYDVVKPVGLYSRALVSFSVDKTGLELVLVAFPDQKSKVDIKSERYLKTGAYQEMTPKDCAVTFATLLEALQAKYGRPELLQPLKSAMWLTGAGDTVVLGSSPSTSSPGLCGVIVMYSKTPTAAQVTKGL